MIIWIKNIISNRKKNKATKKLIKSGLECRKTALGQAAFIPKGTTQQYAEKILFPSDWTSSQLIAIGKYMRAYPNCTIFSDGSGKPCK